MALTLRIVGSLGESLANRKLDPVDYFRFARHSLRIAVFTWSHCAAPPCLSFRATSKSIRTPFISIDESGGATDAVADNGYIGFNKYWHAGIKLGRNPEERRRVVLRYARRKGSSARSVPPSAAPQCPHKILSVINLGGTRRLGGDNTLSFLHFVETIGSQICESLHFSRGPDNVGFVHAVVAAKP